MKQSFRGGTKVDEVLSRIVRLLREKYRPESIVLFGSHAYGTPTPESDIDLLIIKRTSKPFHERYAEVGGLIRDIRRGWSVSPFVISPSELRERIRMGDPFILEIMSKGRSLYGRKGIPAA